MERLHVFFDVVNGIPATTNVKLAGRAVHRRRGLSALVR